MDYKVDSIRELKNTTGDLLNFIYEGLAIPQDDNYLKDNAQKRIEYFIEDLRDDLMVVVESEYIDKDFRDIYYSYYSSKLTDIPRNCVRLSFFEPTENLGLQNEAVDAMKKSYLGFLVLRPIEQVIGRNVINPIAKRAHAEDMRIMKTLLPSSCLGVKTEAIGFPHSSQDGEMMTCAETTVWGIMEYFGNKYPEYSPMKGSKIHKSLAQSAFQRQLPSSGLSFQQISIALKEAGFGPKVYYDNGNIDELKEILSCYIESGIPAAVCIENDYIRHAIICVGHEKVDISNIDTAPVEYISGTKLHIWNRNISKFIFNDDNQNPYELADYSNPAEKYVADGNAEWEDAKISILIVPLNNKIYLEAKAAINLAKEMAVKVLDVRPKSVIRTFLASSRTYKEFLLFKSGIPTDLRDYYYNLDFPKFVWVTEISDIAVCKQGKFNGLLIFDATNPMTDIQNILWAQYDGFYYYYNRETQKVKQSVKECLSFDLNQFDLNLK